MAGEQVAGLNLDEILKVHEEPAPKAPSLTKASFLKSIHAKLVLGLGCDPKELSGIGLMPAYFLSQLYGLGLLTQETKAHWFSLATTMKQREFKALFEKTKADELAALSITFEPAEPEPESVLVPASAPEIPLVFSSVVTNEELEDLQFALDKASVISDRVGGQLQVIALEYLSSFSDTFGVKDVARLHHLLVRIEQMFDISIVARDKSGELIFGALTECPILGTSNDLECEKAVGAGGSCRSGDVEESTVKEK